MDSSPTPPPTQEGGDQPLSWPDGRRRRSRRAFTGAAAAAIGLSLFGGRALSAADPAGDPELASADSRQSSRATDRPTIVLVHGAWADGSTLSIVSE